jgi:uncharacterized membrane protein YdbT with pleckstrin-like domain
MPRQLLAGENLVLPPIRHHWALLARKLGWPVLWALLVVAVLNTVAGGVLPADLRLLGTVGALAALGLWTIAAWLRWTEDSLTVTDQRVILQEGLLRRSSKVIPLNRVQDVSTTQTLLGRILDYGTVEIDAAGRSGSERFAYVGSPEGLRDQVIRLTGRLGTSV